MRWLALVMMVGVGCSRSKAGPLDGAVADLPMSGEDALPFDGSHPDLFEAQYAHGNYYRYVVNRLILPKKKTDFAIDLNGDGITDNQLGQIIALLIDLGFDPQAAIDASISSGQMVHLLRLQTEDPLLKDDLLAGVTRYAGQPKDSPDFSGNGSFDINNQHPASDFFGTIVQGQFSSHNPATSSYPVTVQWELLLFKALMLTINGAHIQFKTGTDPQSGAAGLLSGQLQGSMKDSDVQGVVVPAIAVWLTQQIAADPNGKTAMQIGKLFDTGGCTNPNGTIAVASDQMIDPCEVSSSPVGSYLAPDVQIYDGNGKYAPNPLNTKEDSLSLAFGFTAVSGKY